MHLLVSMLLVVQTQISGWEIFEGTRFEWQYADAFGLEVEIPIFDDRVQKLDGEYVTITGYYLPIDLEGNRMIISKMPYAACFFCGGGVGQESVAEVQLFSRRYDFEMDELVTVKGRLKLNKDDFNHLVFILEEAVVIEK